MAAIGEQQRRLRFPIEEKRKKSGWSRRWFVLNEKTGKLGYTKKQEERHFHGVITLELHRNRATLTDEQLEVHTISAWKEGKSQQYGEVVRAAQLMFGRPLIWVTYLTSHQHPTWSLDDLPRIVACTMHQGSAVTSMDFQPSHHTLLLPMMVFDQ